jgi:hypothetical protein
MLRIVLPFPLALPTIHIVSIEIVILIKIIVVVNVDVAAVPIAISPVATPGAPGGGSQRDSRSPC